MGSRQKKRSAPEQNDASDEEAQTDAVADGHCRLAPTDEDKNTVVRTVAGMIDGNQESIRVAKLVGALAGQDKGETIAYAVAKRMEEKYRRINGKTVLKEVVEMSQCKDEESIKVAFESLNKYGAEYIDSGSMVAAAKECGIELDEDDVACLEKLAGLTEKDMTQWLLDEEES